MALGESLTASVCCTVTQQRDRRNAGSKAERGNRDQAMPRNAKERIEDKDMAGS